MNDNICHMCLQFLTHWGWMTHICVSDLTIIGSDNGLSPGRRQAIIRTNAGILLIRTLGTNFSEILIKILIFQFKKMRLKVSSAKRRPSCLSLNVLTFTNGVPGRRGGTITVTSHEQHGISNHWQFHCLLNHFFFRHTSKKRSNLITVHLWWEPTSHWWISLTKGQ